MAELFGSYTRNQAAQAASYLAQEHGFSPSHLGAQGMVKVLDEQHAVKVFLSSDTLYARHPVDEPGDWSLRFGFARRDVNEYTTLWLGQPNVVWSNVATVYEYRRGRFITEKPLHWSKDEPFEHARDPLEAALVVAEEWPNLERIEQELYEPTHGNGFIGFGAVVNDALSGSDRAESHYKFRWKMLEGNVGPGPTWDAMERFDQQLQAFKVANPNGIPRS